MRLEFIFSSLITKLIEYEHSWNFSGAVWMDGIKTAWRLHFLIYKLISSKGVCANPKGMIFEPLKAGINFAYFGMEGGMVFEGSM